MDVWWSPASIIAILSLVVLIVRELGNWRSSKKFSDAKNAEIGVLNRQIQFLQDITPPKIQEILKASQEIMGQQIDGLQRERDQAQEEARNSVGENQELAAKVSSLELQIKELQDGREAVTRVAKLSAAGQLQVLSGTIYSYAPDVTVSAPVYVPEDDEGHKLNS